MKAAFCKYQGTGNDFIIIDNCGNTFPKNEKEFIKKICHRHFGIGADGVILLEDHPTLDFTMVYFNADGGLGSMCGNGGRCIVHFAKWLGVISDNATFEATDGEHEATIDKSGIISLKMMDVLEIETHPDYTFLNTGSPHHVLLCEDLENFDVQKEGSKLRYEIYGNEGANINFVKQISSDVFSVRTYERGVEAETLSCGTGVTAVALAMYHSGITKSNNISLKTPGGDLRVKFEKTNAGYENIYLIGPAIMVFKGELQW